jgi:plastocyanin
MNVSPKVFLLIAGMVILGASCQNAKNADTATQPVVQANGLTATVLMKNGSFEPDLITVTKGTRVIFKNADAAPHWPASNPHPTHDIYPEFDPQQNVDPGTEWSFIFGKVGTWKYHDHLNPTVRGTVVVTE